MAVRDVVGDGGKGIKPIEGDIKLKKVAEEEDPIEKMEQATYRGARYRAFTQAAGIQPAGQGATPVRTEERIDIASIFNALSAQVTNLISQVTGSQRPNTPDPLLTHLEAELRETRAKLDSTGDPMATAIATWEKLNGMAQTMKQGLGLPQGIQVGPNDLQATIQLQQLKMEQEERRQHWDTEMEERRQQWKREDQRWQEEFRLKKMEFFDGQDRREKSGGILENLAGALIEGIDTERGVADQPKQQSFPCEVCRSQVPVPQGATEGQKVKCPRCEESYTLAAKASTTP